MEYHESSRKDSTLPQLLSQENLGLYNPQDLRSELKKIGDANNINSWQIGNETSEQNEETVAYFLGQDVACKLWRSARTRNLSMPFLGVEKLTIPDKEKQTPQDVLLVGCASIGSYELEQKALEELGIPVRNHWTIDISNLPLQRIKKSLPKTVFFDNLPAQKQQALLQGEPAENQILLKQDAKDMPVPNGFFNIVMTDLLFGSVGSDTEKQILKEIGRVMKPDGQFIMRASVVSDTNIQKMPPIMDITGLGWYQYMKSNYGENPLTQRDNYMNLTHEQWTEFGKLYSNFIQKHYYGKDRFRSFDEIKKFIEQTGELKLQEQVEETFEIGMPEKTHPDPLKYYALRASKKI
jgi:SAM-dependent methyltransferase